MSPNQLWSQSAPKKQRERKKILVLCKIFDLQVLLLDRFNRFSFSQQPLNSFLLSQNPNLACMWASLKTDCTFFLSCTPVKMSLPFESERLASVWTTKKWGRTPGWNLLSISSMMSLMCLLPTATKILLAACCQSGMTSWINHDGRTTMKRM